MPREPFKALPGGVGNVANPTPYDQGIAAHPELWRSPFTPAGDTSKNRTSPFKL